MAEYAVLTADQGTDTIFRIELVDSDKSAKDLTNFTASAKFKKTYASADSNSFTTEIPTPKTQGFVDLTLNGSTTNAIKAGRYVYDVELQNGATTERVLEGILEISPCVTKSDTA
jgi:hypothetical protein